MRTSFQELRSRARRSTPRYGRWSREKWREEQSESAASREEKRLRGERTAQNRKEESKARRATLPATLAPRGYEERTRRNRSSNRSFWSPIGSHRSPFHAEPVHCSIGDPSQSRDSLLGTSNPPVESPFPDRSWSLEWKRSPALRPPIDTSR